MSDNKTYDVLKEIEQSPITRSALKKKFGNEIPNYKTILQWCVGRNFIIRNTDNKYIITELGECWLDHIDEDRINRGVYTG